MHSNATVQNAATWTLDSLNPYQWDAFISDPNKKNTLSLKDIQLPCGQVDFGEFIEHKMVEDTQIDKTE